MQNKLQELTEKIYQEGIAKGNEEAESIITEANSKADEIVKKAKAEADKIIADAKKNAEEMAKNMQSELQLNLRQAVNALKIHIADLIQKHIISEPVKASFKKQDFINELIVIIAKNWSSDTSAGGLALMLPKDKLNEVNSFISKEAKNLLDKGLNIKVSEPLKSGFEIGPKDGSYKISITDDDFKNYLKDYISPRIIKLLFD